jgi:hypothetical protein
MTREQALKRAADAALSVERGGLWGAIADLLLDVQRETAERCAEIVMDADVVSCGGYERQDDGRSTLESARKDIRGAFGLEGK